MVLFFFVLFLPARYAVTNKSGIRVYDHENKTKNFREMEKQFHYLDAIRTAVSQIKTADRQGEERGMAEGIKKGKFEEKFEIANKLLNLHDTKTIADITGLTVKEVEELKKNQ